jgi:hypothetical protein
VMPACFSRPRQIASFAPGHPERAGGQFPHEQAAARLPSVNAR